ncbi:MAG TPA: DUF3501 domain-containing protein [Rhodocyclaceae bacterium]|nr:MAG: hypothetical protein AUK49_12215 [Betaproteobacteria bacterium CG2_30_68_42]PIV75693.1 MAG: DUF3501 domain-containing protein [Rhodocyclales bacterium CG17_big_fil_post_rev_8_21_14_2_50_68_7]PIX75303.1 MAG: DUF3501 domain-containing protein [Rhodocyclales bacterium CG_4_10_14_3_um_filter_68_10]PJA56446.1 MAG: DUF3501 domain-containing protein [Rhodocyclales bacterium CG_4_9_14_3_um_filter_68_10]HCX33475.1 DUF3501 domain-containing protein [Rhodocyclaceae bacterium]
MPALRREDLLSLEAYARQRQALRAEAIAHKKLRSVRLGEDLTLLFEDEITVRYQIQEMLRIERIFEEEGILAELAAYDPMVPDGSNFKATMMLEYPDPELRRERLARLIGIEDRVWLRVAGSPAVRAIADEDLERENAEKTSAVHFLRFELSEAMKRALKAGAALSLGVDHPEYSASVDPVPAALRESLVGDLA